MIRQPTVLVLGAGASLEYGFPSGPKLVAQLCTELSGGDIRERLRWNGVTDVEIQGFRDDLLESARTSVDAFIEGRGEDWIDKVGRLAIAQHLLNWETDTLLRPATDWYGMLIEPLLGNSVSQFKENQLKVITFNFDRSFERKLFLALRANYPSQDLDALVQVIPVLHIHGMLGYPNWTEAPAGAWMRPYEPSHDPLVIGKCADEIHIVHHDIDDQTLITARTWLGQAARICFLGFSYHELNLRKLGVPDVFRHPRRFGCSGTAFGMQAGPRSRAQRLLEDTVTLSPMLIDIVQFVNLNGSFLYE